MIEINKFIINIKLTIRDAFKAMVINNKKIIIVVNDDGHCVGIVTDGDLRRHSNNLYQKSISKISTKNPTWIAKDETALAALEKITNSKITSLLVTQNKDIKKKNKKLIGVLHLHHLPLGRGIK